MTRTTTATAVVTGLLAPAALLLIVAAPATAHTPHPGAPTIIAPRGESDPSDDDPYCSSPADLEAALRCLPGDEFVAPLPRPRSSR
ncbi:hypothetical protein ACWDYH_35665 [Nocardia goodfellowii]